MGNCDLCNDIIGANAKRFSASQIKKAVRNGLRPESSMGAIATSFGISQQEQMSGWVNMVMTDTSDWALCPECSGKVDLYLIKKKGLKDFTTGKRFIALFDKERFGINFYVGVGFIVASVISMFTWGAVSSLLSGHRYDFFMTNFMFIQFFFSIIEASIFVFLIHHIRNEWSLILLWGLTIVIIGIAHRTLLNEMSIENISFGPSLAPSLLISSFIWGFLFMAGLVIMIRAFGPNLWGFTIGLMSAFFINGLIRSIQILFSKIEGISYSVELTTAVLNGLLYGLFIYTGLVLFLKRKGFKISS